MKIVTKVVCAALLAVSFATTGMQVANAVDQVSLTVSAPTRVKLNAPFTIKFQLGRAVKGTCYALGKGNIELGRTSVNGKTAQIKLKKTRDYMYYLFCSDKTWTTAMAQKQIMLGY